MKRVFFALIISLVTLSTSAQEHLKVKGVPIDGNITNFLAKLRETGLKTNSVYSEALGRPILTGDFAGLSDCNFSFITTNDGTVAKVIIISDNIVGWYSCKSKYNSLKESLSAKYTLDRDFEYFRSPYYEGDGYELSALKQEKATWITFFDADNGAISLSIDASNSTEGYLTICYEDKINMAKVVAERDQRINDDL